MEQGDINRPACRLLGPPISALRSLRRSPGVVSVVSPQPAPVVPPVVVEQPVIVVPPPRPASCGEYRYWNGQYCVDARYNRPYLGPRP